MQERRTDCRVAERRKLVGARLSSVLDLQEENISGEKLRPLLDQRERLKDTVAGIDSRR